MKTLFKLQDRLAGGLKAAGALALTAMMLLTVADVTGRFFKHPVFGSVELVGFLAVIVAAAALPCTYRSNGHVGVELFLRYLPKRARLWVELCTRILTLTLAALIAWQMFVYAQDLKATCEVSMNLEFPVFYVVYLLAGGLTVFCVTILQCIADTLGQIKES